MAVFCGALYLPGLFTLPPIDRDEPRFAQASRQMLHATSLDDWVVPHVQDAPRLKKPPLIYWLQAASASLLGEGEHNAAVRTGGIGAYRLPSAVCALAAVLCTWRLGLALFHPLAAWIGAALLASSWVVVVDAHLARADQLLLACTALTQWSLWRIWRTARRGAVARYWPFLFWIGVALGTMAKGPVTPAIAALTVAALCMATRRWRWIGRLRFGLGAIVVAAIVAPWVILVARAVGWEMLRDTIVDEVLLRSTTVKEGHFGPPGYHLVLMPLLFWPGSLLAIAGLQRAWQVARCSRPAETFLLAWLVPGWVVFELLMTKLPHYPLPLYPALALLTGRVVCAVASGRWALPRTRAVAAGVALWAVLGGAGLVAPLVVPIAFGTTPSAGAIAVVSVALLLLAAATGAILRRMVVMAHALAAGAMILVAVYLFRVVLPRADPLWLPSRAVMLVMEQDPLLDQPLAAAGYFEDSLVFLTDGRIQRLAADGAATWLSESPRGLLIADASIELSGFRDVARLEGFQYSNGRWVSLRIVASGNAE